MAKPTHYLTLETSFIAGTLLGPGKVVPAELVTGTPGRTLAPCDENGKPTGAPAIPAAPATPAGGGDAAVTDGGVDYKALYEASEAERKRLVAEALTAEADAAPAADASQEVRTATTDALTAPAPAVEPTGRQPRK